MPERRSTYINLKVQMLHRNFMLLVTYALYCHRMFEYGYNSHYKMHIYAIAMNKTIEKGLPLFCSKNYI